MEEKEKISKLHISHNKRFTLDEIIDSIGDSVSIQDTDFKILYQNKFSRDMAGDHIGEHCYSVYERTGYVCDECPLKECFKDGQMHRMERINTKADGGAFYVEITASPLHGPTGEIVAGVEILRDITERKLVETRLKESEEKYRTVFEESKDIIFITSVDGNIVDISPPASKLFGYAMDELIGMNIHGLCVNPSCHFEFQKGIEQHGFVKDYEVKMRKKDWSEMDCVITASSRKTNGDNIIGYQGIIRDITAQKAMEEKLTSMLVNDELTGLLNRRGFFEFAPKQLKLCCRNSSEAVLLFADLDDLKKINDEMGHQEGDMALIDIATALKETFRETDSVARIGGDEFVVLMPESTKSHIDAAADRLQKRLNTLNADGKRRYKLSLSIGRAYYDSEQPCSIDELISRADKSMYEQKKNRKKLKSN